MSKHNELEMDTFFLDSNIEKLNVEFIFIDANKNIEAVTNEYIELEKKNLLQKNELIKLIKKYLKYNNKNYTTSAILKHNISVNQKNLKQYIQYPIDFLIEINEITDIKWKQCSNYFNSLNKLYLILKHQPSPPIENRFIKTKKIKTKNKPNRKKTRKNKNKKKNKN